MVLSTMLAVVWPAGGQTSVYAQAAAGAVRAALDSMGGVPVVRSIVRVRVDGAGYSMGDGDPPAPAVFSFTETRDDRHPTLEQDVEIIAGPGAVTRSVRTLTLSGDSVRIDSQGKTQHRSARAMDDWFTEAPENVLLAALDSPDLARDGDHAVRFIWHGRAVRVGFSATTSMVAFVELDGVTTSYSRWRATGGTRYPRQWNMSHDGVSTESYTARQVTISRG